MIFVEAIRRHKYYKVFLMGEKPIIVFEDHRFVIPVLWLAHQCRILSPQVNMFRFDGHLDNLDYDQELSPAFKALRTFGEAFEFAENQMKKEDDDWLMLALDQKLINKALTICGRADEPNPRYGERNFKLASLNAVSGNDKEFLGGPVLLDIDCDYFVFQSQKKWSAWTTEMYEKEFSNFHIEKVLETAPFVTICRETDFCGGPENVRDILGQMNTFIFSGALPYRSGIQ